MTFNEEFLGEIVGTFIMVLFGCGSVAVTVLFGAHNSLYQVAAIWGLAVTLSIYATRHLSNAHLNPAVSIAMVLSKRMKLNQLALYIPAQLLGAFLAAVVLYLLFSSSILNYEVMHNIIRGEADSIKTAMMFGEYYPNPGNSEVTVSLLNAFTAELIGTGVLIFMIFALTDTANVGKPDDNLTPLFIGGTVSLIICIIAPLTQAGLNPARDFGPRLFAYFAGWGDVAFPDNQYGFFIVYILGPIVGGIVASSFYTIMFKPAMEKKRNLVVTEKELTDINN